MDFKTVRSVFWGILVMLCGPIAAHAQAADMRAHAQEILDQARAALGGNAALAAVRSLSAFGDFRSGAGSAEASGDVQLDLLLPDKAMRIMKWSPTQEMKITSVEAMDGSEVWTDSRMKESGTMMSNGPMGGGMGRGGRGGGRRGGRRSVGTGGSSGGSAGNGGIKGLAPNPMEGTDNEQIQSDFSSLMLALFLRLPDSSQIEAGPLQEVDIDGVKTDCLRITAGNGPAINLSIDQKTHRPIAASYSEATANKNGSGEKQAASSESKPAQIQIYFSEYKTVAEKGFGDIWLPYQITKTRDGVTVEDMHINKFQLNSHLKAKQFEKKKV